MAIISSPLPRIATVLLCSLLLSSAAWASEHDDAIDVTFPDKLGGLSLQGRQTFGQKALGASYGYQNEWGSLRVGIYVYNGGLRSIPGDLAAPVVRRHFEQVIGEAKSLQATGQVRAVELTDTAPLLTALPGCGPQFVHQGFTMEMNAGLQLTSATWLTVMRDNFIKLRVSYRSNAPEEAAYAERFIGELRRTLGHCPVQVAGLP
jgi:hypothetical protein